jgi:hypothetical protein
MGKIAERRREIERLLDEARAANAEAQQNLRTTERMLCRQALDTAREQLKDRDLATEVGRKLVVDIISAYLRDVPEERRTITNAVSWATEILKDEISERTIWRIIDKALPTLEEEWPGCNLQEVAYKVIGVHRCQTPGYAWSEDLSAFVSAPGAEPGKVIVCEHVPAVAFCMKCGKQRRLKDDEIASNQIIRE